jgi:hypothetical protein
MVPDGELRVHTAKVTDQRPCPGSWPDKPAPKPTSTKQVDGSIFAVPKEKK